MNSKLKAITDTLLFEPFNYKALYDGVHQLHDLFALTTGVTAGDITDEDIYLPSGKAVSSIQAAHCLLEFQRTAVFVRGVYKAVLQLKKDFPGERLHILYAGCGPYTALLLPLTSLFKADELAFHLLDINAVSLEAAKSLYQQFGLNDYVEEWILADAATYHIPRGEIRHLMVSETMQHALKKEPQVDIMQNLIPQLPPKGLFIPQQIAISAKLLNFRLETERNMNPDPEHERTDLGIIYTISREHYSMQKPVTIKIPKDVGQLNQFSLLTDITTYGDEKLQAYDCSLNMPVHLFDVDVHTADKELIFEYIKGEVPGFKYQWVN